LMALDVTNKRAFVTELLYNNRGINKIDIATGLSTSILSGIAGNSTITDIAYDATNDYIYYLKSDGASGSGAEDAIYRLKPDGTGHEKLVGNVADAPGAMALD